VGVSMYMQAIDADGVALLASDPGAVLTSLVDRGWSADQLGWAAFAMAAGVNGLELLAAGGFMIGEARLVPMPVQDELLAALDGVNRVVLEARFDDAAFGEPVGPEPLIDDKEWLVDVALELIELIQSASTSGLRLIWTIL